MQLIPQQQQALPLPANIMTTSFTYYPDRGIEVNDVTINWNSSRTNVRKLLKDRHSPNDAVIELDEYDEGQILQRRDIYQDLFGKGDYFFLNYDEAETLAEIEIHSGIDIVVDKVRVSFDLDISTVVSQLKSLSEEKELSEGEFLFENLKLTISDSESMGGDGHKIAYIYLTKNIDHLTE